jgi:hypothetical protein
MARKRAEEPSEEESLGRYTEGLRGTTRNLRTISATAEIRTRYPPQFSQK